MAQTYGPPIKLQGRKRYYCRLYDRSSGRRSWICTGFETLKEARTWVESRRADQAYGPTIAQARNASEITLGDAVSKWLADKEEHIGPARFAGYKGRAEGFWIPFFGATTRLADMEPDKLKSYLAKRRRGLLKSASPRSPRDPRKSPPAPRPLAATTVNDDRANLAVFFNYALRHGWIQKTPMLAVDRYEGEIKRRVRQLSIAEEEKLLLACSEAVKVTVTGKRNSGGQGGGKSTSEKATWVQNFAPPAWLRPLVTVAIRCGFRRGTILALEWEHIDFECGRWSIPGEIVKTREDYAAPVPVSVLAVLKAWRKHVAKTRGAQAVKATERIFSDLDPKAKFGRTFRMAAKRAGLRALTFHDLRRVFLNRCRESGVPLEVTMALSGHKSIAVVQKFYREIPWKDLEEAVRAADAHRGATGELPAPAATEKALG